MTVEHVLVLHPELVPDWLYDYVIDVALTALRLGAREVQVACLECREEYHPAQDEFDAMAEGYGREPLAALGVEYDSDFVLYRGKG